MPDKARNPFVSPGVRLVQLYILMLSSNRSYCLSQLAKLMKCSRQTVLRMMEQMDCLRDVEIKSWMERNVRHFRIIPSKHPRQISFTADAIHNLALCQDIVRHLLPGPLQQELRGVLDAAVEHPTLRDKSGVESLAEPWVKGCIDYTCCQATLQDIQAAMREQRLCDVTYNSRSKGDTQTLLVAPLRIIAYHEALYLRCRLYDAPTKANPEFRTLAIHRITRLKPRRESFCDKPEDDREPHFGFPFHKPIRVRIAFWRGAATYVAERRWSADQILKKRRDGAVELTLTTTSRVEIIAWVLSFGPDAELLEPTELREEIRLQVRNIQARYETQAHSGLLCRKGKNCNESSESQ